MDISTGSWFKYLREEVLTEGVRDIGLPEAVVDFIEDAMVKSPEKTKTYVGNEWKKNTLNPAYRDRYVDEVWHKFMLRNFRNQIEGSRQFGLDNDAGLPLQARTHAVYDEHGMEDSPPEKRVKYDEETVKQNKMVAFVVENIDNVLSKPMGTWRKAFAKALKALSKAGIPSEKVEVVKNELDRITIGEFRTFWNRYDTLFAWLNDEPTNYELIKGEYSLQDALNIAQEDLNNKEDPDNIIHTFEDGSYWYNLEVSNCPVEGERMGHCGSDTRGTLVSLRKRQGSRKASSSYVTMTWDGETLYQIKGRSNDAPPMEMWDHIEWFIRNMDVSSVEETGEHSNDHEGFQEMNEYLQQRNQGVSFTGAIDEAAIQEAIDEVVNDYEGENSSIGGEAQGPDEHGGEGVYVYMNGYCSMQIDLGWRGFRAGNNEFAATLGPDDGTPDERFETIPENTWGGGARDFISEIGVDDISYNLPGESEIEWDLQMLTGAQPDGEDMDPDYPATAHLVIEIRCTEQEPATDDDDAKQNMEYFGKEVYGNFEEDYAENLEAVRIKLAKEGYSVKTAYDRDRAEMSGYDLEHWKVYTEGAGLEFWFRPATGDTPSDSLVEAGKMPVDLLMWGHEPARDGHIDHLYTRIFGTPSDGRGKYTSDDLNRNMARNLEAAYRDISSDVSTSDSQGQFPFGDKYAAKFVPIVLANDSRFIIEGGAKYHGVGEGAYPHMPISWRYTIGVGSSASAEEIETVKHIVKYFNAHPDMVRAAAQKVIDSALEGSMALARAKKEDVISGRLPQAAIRDIDSRYAAASIPGAADIDARHIILLATWIKNNFDQMNDPEKWVAWYRYLSPMKSGTFRPHQNPIETDMSSGSPDFGKPQAWDDKVRAQMQALRTFSGTVRGYSGVQRAATQAATIGEPRDAGGPVVRNARGERMAESVEQQIDRVESLLREKDATYDLRLYSIKLDVAVQKDIGGEVQETQTEIRGIEGVTTVRTIGTPRNTLQALLATYEIKFELLGASSRVKYRDRILLPGLRRVRGLRILTVSPIHRTNTRGTIRTVRENSATMKEYVGGSLGGIGGNSGTQHTRGTPPLPTPRDTLKGILDDWQQAGVMTYDIPMDTTNMAYHVMMPVEELIPLMGREFRAPMDGFDGMYQNFIKSGADSPVYVAVGKNGRIKITGNEDLVWFAKKSGLEELPVFLSYQRQV
jgi:hypothetical protein